MLSAYPTKHSRIGNAVGLDTPPSRRSGCCGAMRDAGYDLGAGDGAGLALPGDTDRTGDALIHALIAAGGQDEEWLTDGAARPATRCGSRAAEYRALVRRSCRPS